MLAQRLAEPLGQSVIVENRAGAGGGIAIAQDVRLIKSSGVKPE